MRIEFNVADQPAVFRWDNMTGQTELETADGQVVVLQSAKNPGAHVSVSLTRTWDAQVGGHQVAITKVRPLLLAPFRPNAFSVLVDGQLVAQAKGL